MPGVIPPIAVELLNEDEEEEEEGEEQEDDNASMVESYS